jgi:hypothetical protein
LLLVPVVTSRAEARKIDFASFGDKPGCACFSRAQTPASCGEAALVPLMAAHPSLLAVSSPFGWVPPETPASIALPGGTGSIM